jgi:hypothetical protein
VTLAEAASWATIAALLVAVVGLVVTVLVAAGSTQRDLRQQLRERLEAISAECAKARNAINLGADIPFIGEEVPRTPPEIADSPTNLRKFRDEIRFIRNRDMNELARTLETVSETWHLVTGQIFDDQLDTKFRDKNLQPSSLRRRIRAENMLLQIMEISDRQIDKMLMRLKKLDRRNVVGAWLVR